jgi:hypothetical protein
VFDRLGSKAGFQNSNGVSNRLLSQRATSVGGLAGPALAQPDTVPKVVNSAAASPTTRVLTGLPQLNVGIVKREGPTWLDSAAVARIFKDLLLWLGVTQGLISP